MKSKISATIIADSINPQGNRITTYELIYPRFIHGEVLTHRMFSKNSASSRAIPFNKMKEMVMNDPFIPIAWQKDHKGMQGTEYFNSHFSLTGNYNSDIHYGYWMDARDLAVEYATYLNDEGLTKQLCNRLLEPFMWHKVLLTATEFENFFNLRCPQYEVPYTWDEATKVFKSRKDATKYWQDKADIDPSIGKPKDRSDLEWLKLNKSQAEIHIQALAEAMYDAMNESTPVELKAGEWHMPYGNDIEFTPHKSKETGNLVSYRRCVKLKISTARCARLSYQTVGDNPKIDYEADIRLHDMLLKHHHMSPFEHCAKAMSHEEYFLFRKGKGETDYSLGISSSNPVVTHDKKDYGWCRNFKGFIQYRHLLENDLKL